MLEILGRLDEQVKLRGFRIELGEVAAALETHPAVREAVVEVRESASENTAGERRLVAWIVSEGGDADAAALRNHLAALLPGPMVPSVFAWLPALPLTPNGKADRRALAALPLPGPAPAATCRCVSRGASACRSSAASGCTARPPAKCPC